MIQPQYVQQQYPQTPSAVSINIYEPKSYAQAPAQQAPYGYTNELYNMPQTSAWAQPGMQSPFQQYAPVNAPMYQPIPQYPTSQDVQFQPTEYSPVTPAPAVQQTPEQAQAQDVQAPQVGPQEQQAPKVDTDALLNDLASQDYNTQAEAITSIANFTQATPDIALQVATDPVKQSLVNIIKTDTSALPDVTEEQKALEEKQKKGTQLTAEEQAKLSELSPKNAADKNRIFALFTLAMVQKLARDNQEQYSQFQQEQGGQAAQPLGLENLAGYQEIKNTIQNDTNPEVKIAAIQALQYMAKPEEKATVEEVLKTSLQDSDAKVQQAAQEAIAKLGAPEGQAAPAADQAAQQAAPAADQAAPAAEQAAQQAAPAEQPAQQAAQQAA